MIVEYQFEQKDFDAMQLLIILFVCCQLSN